MSTPTCFLAKCATCKVFIEFIKNGGTSVGDINCTLADEYVHEESICKACGMVKENKDI